MNNIVVILLLLLSAAIVSTIAVLIYIDVEKSKANKLSGTDVTAKIIAQEKIPIIITIIISVILLHIFIYLIYLGFSKKPVVCPVTVCPDPDVYISNKEIAEMENIACKLENFSNKVEALKLKCGSGIPSCGPPKNKPGECSLPVKPAQVIAKPTTTIVPQSTIQPTTTVVPQPTIVPQTAMEH